MYGTATGFNTYHTARGREATVDAFDDDAIAAALLIASEWLDARYRTSFPGYKVGQREQAREWPRYGGQDVYGYAISSSSVPTEIENATYEAAYRELQNSGTLSVDYTASQYRRVSVSGAVNVEYRDVNPIDIQTNIQIVNEILAPILTGCGNVSTLSGPVSLA